MQTVSTPRPTLAKFAGTCRWCMKAIRNGERLLPSTTITGAKGKQAFIHEACYAIEQNNGKPAEVKNVDVPPVEIKTPNVVTTMPVASTRMTPDQFLEMYRKVQDQIEFNVDITDDLKPLEKKFTDLRVELTEQLKNIATLKTSGTFKIDVTVANMPKVTLKETPNAAFEKVLRLCANRKNTLLVGPAGSGKTHLAETVAKVLKLRFAHISCSAGMSEGHLLGRLLPTGKNGAFEYTESEFVKCYENGGVFLIDEIDAADSNTMLVINSALANGFLSIPNRTKKPVAHRHKDFVCIAAANTFGRGADRMYVGRNQLDESTIDRFRIGQVSVDYDDNVEASLCPDTALRLALRGVREKVMLHGMRRVVSTRFMKDAYEMLQNGFTETDIFAALTFGWSKDEQAKVS